MAWNNPKTKITRLGVDDTEFVMFATTVALVVRNASDLDKHDIDKVMGNDGSFTLIIRQYLALAEHFKTTCRPNGLDNSTRWKKANHPPVVNTER
jgi:hypothetical protein